MRHLYTAQKEDGPSGFCTRRFSLKICLLWSAVAVAYYLWFQGFYNKIAYGKVLAYASLSEAAQGMTMNFIPIALTFMMNHLVVFTLTHRLKKAGLKIIADIAGSCLSLVIINIAYRLITNGHIDWAGTLFNNIFIFLGMEVAYYVKNFRNSVNEVERKQRQVLQYKYDALKAQVNPHFLFNSLNILYSLIDIDINKSRTFVMSLSQMYRYIMLQHDRDRVELSEEMTFLSAYVDVLKMRYHNCFEVEIKGEENIKGHEIIPYCMQLLIENVTKHNVIQTDTPMTVRIDISDSHITVSNPINRKRTPPSSGIGLHYISELYRHYGKDFSYNDDGRVFTAVVPYLE